jgi:hypothetical protein
MSNNSGDKELLLVEFKARVKPETARAEAERIDALWSNGLMDEESIFCEITSDEPDSFDFIPSEQERYQAIHHTAVYEKNLILHVVGDSKEILSCTKMTFTPDLLEAHQRTTDLFGFETSHISTKSQKEFQWCQRVHGYAKACCECEQRYIDMRTFQFNYMLHRVATQIRTVHCRLLLEFFTVLMLIGTKSSQVVTSIHKCCGRPTLSPPNVLLSVPLSNSCSIANIIPDSPP